MLPPPDECQPRTDSAAVEVEEADLQAVHVLGVVGDSDLDAVDVSAGVAEAALGAVDVVGMVEEAALDARHRLLVAAVDFSLHLHCVLRRIRQKCQVRLAQRLRPAIKI